MVDVLRVVEGTIRVTEQAERASVARATVANKAAVIFTARQNVLFKVSISFWE
jgi:hypothetical protein